jgi:hypothetical protein
MAIGGKRLAVLLGQLGIDEIPLGLEHAPEDGSTGQLRGGFQIVQSGVWLEGGNIGRWEVEGREFGHGIACRIVDAADQYTDVAHERSFVSTAA